MPITKIKHLKKKNIGHMFLVKMPLLLFPQINGVIIGPFLISLIGRENVNRIHIVF
jgi:hypothetical protein